MRAPTPDAVVIGGGLVGCLAARALAAEGLTVDVVERGAELGREASWAAAGMLSPQMEAAEAILVGAGPEAERRQRAMLDLCVAGRAIYAAFVRALEEETGVRAHYRADGTLVVAADDAEAGALAVRADAQRAMGLRAEWLDPPRARALEPAIARGARGALHLPDDHSIDNLALVAAAAAALEASPRIRVRTGAPVERIVVTSGRVEAVVAAGERTRAGHVVLAAGAWTGAVAGVPARVPVRPVKGQMAALRPAGPVIGRTVGGRGVYCVPRDDGRILVGATVEEAGYDKAVDPAAVEGLLAAASAILPVLAAAPVESRWAGLRPGTADDLPILGLDPDVGGLVWATGHYRNGILLAPITAAIVAALVAGREPPADLSSFAPDRPLDG